ncbi:DNA replication terminus site-binding protein [Alteromonas gracilis]|uniref:DNA replication terminus site-binding protein n=1 Tax=Alteromonas gracilis TaxID=1479524 RepID=UPI003735BBD6
MKKTANNLELLATYKRIKENTESLTNYIRRLPTSDLRITAIKLPLDGKEYRVLTDDELDQAINIYTQFSAKMDQDPSRPLRLPGVIQMPKQHQQTVSEIINYINTEKERFESLYIDMTKGLDARKRAKVVHDALGSTSFITLQITRKVTCVCDELIYMGLSYHKKPNIVTLTKKEVLNRLGFLQDRPSQNAPIAEWKRTIKEARDRVELLVEGKYLYRYTKGSYYRPMLNIKSAQGRVEQPSASMPVFYFADDNIKVNLPRKHDNSKRRSDRAFNPECPDLAFANIHIRKVDEG